MKLSLFCPTFLLLLLLFVTQIHAQSQRQASDNREGAASISGRVTIDGRPAVNSAVTLTESDRGEDDGKKGAPGGVPAPGSKPIMRDGIASQSSRKAPIRSMRPRTHTPQKRCVDPASIAE